MDKSPFNSWPSYSKAEADAVRDTLLSNKVNYWTGNECRQFEEEFSSWSNVKYSIAVGNGSLALDLALKAIGINANDEVIVTPRTFIASVSSIVNIGATPIFADVDLESQNITPSSIKAVITSKTKAIICVHLAGWPCEMDEIMVLAKKFGLSVIEDCSQAHGAKYKGKSVGSIGHIGCWSFCQDKIITTGGEGGMVTTNDKVLWQKIWSYKDHGKSYEAVYNKEHSAGFKWLHDSFGTNYRMTEMQAVIGRIQLKKISSWHKKRLDNANKIWINVKHNKTLRIPSIPSYIDHAAYKCYIYVNIDDLRNDWSRNRIINEINILGIPCFSGSCPEVYMEKAFENTTFRPKKRLVNAKELGKTSLMFLVHPSLTEIEVQKQCDAINLVMKKALK